MSKQVMQQGLDALEHAVMASGGETGCDHPIGICFCKENAAIEALRTAIAAPEPEPVGHLYTIAGVQHCTIEKELPDGPLFLTQPDTEALRKELERVKGERDAYRAFIYNLSGSAGGMVNGNRLSISANKVLGFGEVCGKQPEGTPPTNPAESVNCCPGSPGWPVALRDSTIDTITDACFQAVADQGTTVLMRAVARAVERQHGIVSQGEVK